MSLGAPEIAMILVIVLIVFGAGQLPNVLRSMGQGVKAFKDEVKSDDKSDADNDKKKN